MDGLRVSKLTAHFHFWVNYAFNQVCSYAIVTLVKNKGSCWRTEQCFWGTKTYLDYLSSCLITVNQRLRFSAEASEAGILSGRSLKNRAGWALGSLSSLLWCLLGPPAALPNKQSEKCMSHLISCLDARYKQNMLTMYQESIYQAERKRMIG